MTSAETAPHTPSQWAIWVGVATGPVTWTIHLAACYLLVPFACATGYSWVFHLTTGITGGATILAGFLAFRAWRQSGVGLEVDATDWSGIGRLPRRRGFMGLLGVFLSVMFFVLIMAEAVGTVMLSPCQYRQFGGEALWHRPASPIAMLGPRDPVEAVGAHLCVRPRADTRVRPYDQYWTL